VIRVSLDVFEAAGALLDDQIYTVPAYVYVKIDPALDVVHAFLSSAGPWLAIVVSRTAKALNSIVLAVTVWLNNAGYLIHPRIPL
jgi:hypothetical protein